MRSAFAGTGTSATAESLRQVACQPKLTGLHASAGWTTEMFVEVVYNELTAKKGKTK
jgi:hypothetical protein